MPGDGQLPLRASGLTACGGRATEERKRASNTVRGFYVLEVSYL